MPFRDAASSRACGGAINDVVAVVGSPYFLSRSRSVPRFRPSRRAAVDWFQKTAASVSAMTRRSSASICSFNERRRSGGVSAAGSLRTNRSGALANASTPISPPPLSATIRAMAFSSSLTLPGHSASESAWISSGEKRMSSSPKRSAYRRLNSAARAGMSSRRSRRGGTTISTTAKTVVQVFPEASCGGLRF